MEVGAPYLVRWRDSHTAHDSGGGWVSIKSIDKDDYIVCTLGYFIFEDDKYICMAGSIVEGADLTDEDNYVGDASRIPKIGILQTKKLR